MPTVEVGSALALACVLPLLKKLVMLRNAPVPALLPCALLAEVMSNMCTQPWVPSAMRTLIHGPCRSPSRVTAVCTGSGATLREDSPGASRNWAGRLISTASFCAKAALQKTTSAQIPSPA